MTIQQIEASKKSQSKYSHSEKGRAKAKRYREKHQNQIKACGQKHYIENRDRYLNNHKLYFLKKKYGLTPAGYSKMYEQQKGRCMICEQPKEKLHIDHNHITGKTRGLLCPRCNQAVGYLEDKNIIVKAQQYLKNWMDA